jgi:putative oxidoreductase
MRKWLYCDVNNVASLGLLVLRIIMGAAFILHGWPKIQNPTAWLPATNPTPAIFQAMAAVAEFGGGIALVLGVLTRVAAIGLLITMAVAIFTFHLPQSHAFVTLDGSPSWELAGIYCACSLLLLFSGGGRFSLDALLFGRGELDTRPSRDNHL